MIMTNEASLNDSHHDLIGKKNKVQKSKEEYYFRKFPDSRSNQS